MEMFKDYPDVVTVEQMQKMLNISRTTAYSLIAGQQVKSIRIGNRIRIPKKYLVQYVLGIQSVP